MKAKPRNKTPKMSALIAENQRLKEQSITASLLLKRSVIYSFNNWMPLSIAISVGYFANTLFSSTSFDAFAFVVSTAWSWL